MNYEIASVIIVAALSVAGFCWFISHISKKEIQKSKVILHCMIDLETLSTEPNAYIRSLGAAFFDVNGTSRGYYESCDGPDQPGSHVDPKTVAWWDQQTLEAKTALKNPKNIALIDMLHSFRVWLKSEMRQFSLKGDGSDVEVWLWSNGGDFDTVILASAYKRNAMELPWKFYNVRCYRTLKNIFRHIRAEEFVGAKHDALADAQHQARHASRILKHIYV